MSTMEKAPVSYRFRRDRPSAIEREGFGQPNLSFLHEVAADLIIASDGCRQIRPLASFGDREGRPLHGRWCAEHQRIVAADIVVTLRPDRSRIFPRAFSAATGT